MRTPDSNSIRFKFHWKAQLSSLSNDSIAKVPSRTFTNQDEVFFIRGVIIVNSGSLSICGQIVNADARAISKIIVEAAVSRSLLKSQIEGFGFRLIEVLTRSTTNHKSQ